MIDDLRFALRPTVELSETVEETTPEARSKPPPTEIGAAAPPPVREPQAPPQVQRNPLPPRLFPRRRRRNQPATRIQPHSKASRRG